MPNFGAIYKIHVRLRVVLTDIRKEKVFLEIKCEVIQENLHVLSSFGEERGE